LSSSFLTPPPLSPTPSAYTTLFRSPTPTLTVTGRFNRDAEPAPWRKGDAPLDATDLVHHLTRYPRRADAVPEWMSARITAAGLAVPSPGEDVAAPAPTADPPAGAAAPAAPARS